MDVETFRWFVTAFFLFLIVSYLIDKLKNHKS